jgi:hypothetical protein
MTPMAAMTARAARATWAAWPTGPHARRIWSRRAVGPLPGPGRRTVRTLRTEHAGVMLLKGQAVPGNCRAREEDHRHHEHRACDDHHPRCDLIKPGGLRRIRRHMWWWRRLVRVRLGQRFGCVAHSSIMPRQGPLINDLGTQVPRHLRSA